MSNIIDLASHQVRVKSNVPGCACFTPGTLIATRKGERRVEDLQVGDRVITRDNGLQEIRWIGQHALTARDQQKATDLSPVLIEAGALGEGLPERDFLVSPEHKILVSNDKTALHFEDNEVFVAAKDLTDMKGVDVIEVSQTSYIHLHFDDHEVILSNGTWSESPAPKAQSSASVGTAQRQEIVELFPELRDPESVEGYASARRSLTRHEAKIIG